MSGRNTEYSIVNPQSQQKIESVNTNRGIGMINDANLRTSFDSTKNLHHYGNNHLIEDPLVTRFNENAIHNE